MAKGFFFKLAVSNLRRNRRMLAPYFVAATVMVSIYFMAIMIMYSRSIGNLDYGRTIQEMFRFGTVVMTVLIVAFMLYINSFLIKGRKKEFGLYAILGLEKRHVGLVILWENLILSFSSLLLGIAAGAVFGRLVFMLLLYAFRVMAAGTTFTLPWQAFAWTAAVFTGSFILTSLFNLLHVTLANPIDLLAGGQKGEKKLRFILPKTFIGLALLAWAYYSALTVSNPLAALNKFFLAVLLVIAATYILFTTGSLFLLNLLRRNKNLYYRPNNFVAISGMFHRMRQNAAGLATICILSTMVLVTVAGSGSLFIGRESILAFRHPYDVSISLKQDAGAEELAGLNALIAGLEAEHGVKTQDRYDYTLGRTEQTLKNGELNLPDYENYQESADYLIELNIIALADYNAAGREQETLKGNEVIILSSKDPGLPALFSAGSDQYTVRKRIPDSVFSKGRDSFGALYPSIFVVVADENTAASLLAALNPEAALEKAVVFNVSGAEADSLEFAGALRRGALEIGVIRFSDIFTDRVEGYGIFGGLMFLGAFFAVLFLTATILIIYFKQISEGYDDQGRFEILQKVGMDDREVRRTINKQILIVFFLPLAAAFLHVLVASPMIIKLLQVFNLFNVPLTALCTAVTCLVFAIVYVMVYRLTARTYYAIVKW